MEPQLNEIHKTKPNNKFKEATGSHWKSVTLKVRIQGNHCWGITAGGSLPADFEGNDATGSHGKPREAIGDPRSVTLRAGIQEDHYWGTADGR